MKKSSGDVKSVSRGEQLLQTALEKIRPLRQSRPTEEKDSIYHTILGKLNPNKNKIYYDGLPGYKANFIQAIQTASEGSSLARLRDQAIKNLVIDGCYTEGKQISQVRKEYLEFLRENKEEQKNWGEFELYLLNSFPIIAFIEKFAPQSKAKNLKEKFTEVMKLNRSLLIRLIKSIDFLNQRFIGYREKLAVDFKWGNLSSKPVIAEYMDYLKKDRYSASFTDVELSMLAEYSKKRIAVYIFYQEKLLFVDVLNPKITEVCEIQFTEDGRCSRLEKNTELSFSLIVKGKRNSQNVQDIKSPEKIIQSLEAMLAVLDNRPLYEQGLAESALKIIKKMSTTPVQRIKIAERLEKMGYLIHGNLKPQHKVFKPSKITMFNFERPFMDLRLALSKAMSAAKETKEYEALEKRNHLIANIAFNLTYTDEDKTTKKRAIIYMPVYSPTSLVYSEKGKHSEPALSSLLRQGEIIDSMLDDLPDQLFRVNALSVQPVIKKINAVVFQLISRFRSCDDCHMQGLEILMRSLLRVIENKILMRGMAIPKKSPRLAAAVQFCFDFSPLTDESKNSYTRALYYPDNKSPRRNFMSNGLFIQRRTRKISDPDDSDSDKNYTLFLSHGSYSLLSALYKRPSWIDRVSETLLPRSVEKYDISEALKEWEYTGNYRKLEEEDKCRLCKYDGILHEYDIINIYNGNTLSTGSKCITEFDDIQFIDELDIPILGEKNRLRQTAADKTTHEKRKEMKQILQEIPASSTSKENFLDLFYKQNGFFTPIQAVKIAAHMKNKKIRRRYKIDIIGATVEEFANLQSKQLQAIKKWLNKSQKEILGISEKNKSPKTNKNKKNPRKSKQSKILDFLEKVDQLTLKNGIVDSGESFKKFYARKKYLTLRQRNHIQSLCEENQMDFDLLEGVTVKNGLTKLSSKKKVMERSVSSDVEVDDSENKQVAVPSKRKRSTTSSGLASKKPIKHKRKVLLSSQLPDFTPETKRQPSSLKPLDLKIFSPRKSSFSESNEEIQESSSEFGEEESVSDEPISNPLLISNSFSEDLSQVPNLTLKDSPETWRNGFFHEQKGRQSSLAIEMRCKNLVTLQNEYRTHVNKPDREDAADTMIKLCTAEKELIQMLEELYPNTYQGRMQLEEQLNILRARGDRTPQDKIQRSLFEKMSEKYTELVLDRDQVRSASSHAPLSQFSLKKESPVVGNVSLNRSKLPPGSGSRYGLIPRPRGNSSKSCPLSVVKPSSLTSFRSE